MYLKEIRAQGFKSFADKIKIELDDNITGIVGPNGSGKSNIVDAIRWVLGEQSVKSLRGDNTMADVIFSGSKTRNPANMATVTLVFDNKDHFINLDYNDIEVKRRVYNDGTNEYYLNNEQCRLKDIIDLLIDNGITKESFNIISQGRIEEIVANKPSERRTVIEEAAGVLKYKKRKEEALKKLDRTHDNMTRITDIINELETQVEPLKEQSEKASKYITVKEELEGIEIALLVDDITNINHNYKNKKDKITELNNKISGLQVDNSKYDAKIEELKLSISKLDEEIDTKQETFMAIATEVETLNSRKTIILERQKYQVDDTKLHNNIVALKENNCKLENNIKVINGEIDQLINKNKNISNKKHDLEQLITENKNIINKDEIALNMLNKSLISLKNKIDNLRFNIDENSTLPNAVKQVLNNPKLKGIHDALGNIISVDNIYSLAISTSLGVSSANIIVDNENSAKDAINYLKDNNYGRCTFFPLNVIKPRGIEEETITLMEKMDGYIGIASSLVSYDQIYYNIIQNQLGNVIVAKTIESANKISSKTNYRYKVVTLDGTIIHIGGALTGGSQTKTRNIINDKYDLEVSLLNLTQSENEITSLNNKISDDNNKIKELEEKLYLINKEYITNSEYINNKEISKQNLIKELDNNQNEINSTNNIINNTLNKEEEEIINAFYNKKSEKELLEMELSNLDNHKDTLNNELADYQHQQKKDNSAFNELNNELKNVEIEVNRMDVKIDTMLNNLSENYNLSYDVACSMYTLELESKIAHVKVNELKKQLNEIGVVNLGAPQEYKRISERYEFLLKQREDLNNAENTLLEVINEMDNVMKKDFATTFEMVNKNFEKTFKELFNGGNASLKLTDPNNLLETGVEIIASPPGKKLTTISLLSGGEKTLTAISLLFAILKSRKVPFCIFDEVEASLDDVNVESFGNYINNLKDKTQFVLITHKKKTMEFVDVLYGITMQESGVSKLVSVKLKDIK